MWKNRSKAGRCFLTLSGLSQAKEFLECKLELGYEDHCSSDDDDDERTEIRPASKMDSAPARLLCEDEEMREVDGADGNGQSAAEEGKAAKKTLQKKKRKKQSKWNLSKANVPDEIACNPELMKYWYRRYQLFHKFDRGIKLDAGTL